MIADQIDLNWHDAWRTELRGPHGEWVHGEDAKPVWYHGTNRLLKPGDLIRPASQVPDARKYDESSPDHVYVTRDPVLAAEYAGMRDDPDPEKPGDDRYAVYEVEPAGPVEDDPQHTGSREGYDREPNGRTRQPARVVRMLPYTHQQIRDAAVPAERDERDVDQVTASVLSVLEDTASRGGHSREAGHIDAARVAYGMGSPDDAIRHLRAAAKLAQKDPGGDTRVKSYGQAIMRITKDAAQSSPPAPEVYSGQFSDRVLSFWRRETDPDTKQALNVASADLDGQDYDGAAGQLREAARLARARGHSSDASDYQLLAARIAQSVTTEGKAAEFVSREAPKVPSLVGGGKEIWSGQLHTFTGEGNLLGDLDWDGNMRMRSDIAASISQTMTDPSQPIYRPRDFSVPLHELIHGVVPEDQPDRKGDMAAYQNASEADIEEGFTELGTVQHMREFTEQTGISDRKILGGGTLGKYASSLNDPARIKVGNAWGHYADETAAALDWVANVAEADGRPGDYPYMTQLADEINRQGTAGKTLVMAQQVIRTEVTGADARLTADDRSQAQILDQTRQAIISGWTVGGSNVQTAAAARQQARQAAHLIAQEKLMGERSAA